MFCGKWKSLKNCDGMAIPLSRQSAYFECLKGPWKLIRRSWTGFGHHNPKSNPGNLGLQIAVIAPSLSVAPRAVRPVMAFRWRLKDGKPKSNWSRADNTEIKRPAADGLGSGSRGMAGDVIGGGHVAIRAWVRSCSHNK